MPTVMASWNRETCQPRASAGATSEMYTGTVLEDKPIPMPTMIRPTTSIWGDWAAAHRMAPAAKMIAVVISSLRLPNRSASRQPVSAPTAAPASTPLTITSKANVDNVKSFRKNSSAPEITPVSYPKSRPPSAAKAAARQTKRRPDTFGGVTLVCDFASVLIASTFPSDRVPVRRALLWILNGFSIRRYRFTFHPRLWVLHSGSTSHLINRLCGSRPRRSRDLRLQPRHHTPIKNWALEYVWQLRAGPM